MSPRKGRSSAREKVHWYIQSLRRGIIIAVKVYVLWIMVVLIRYATLNLMRCWFRKPFPKIPSEGSVLGLKVHIFTTVKKTSITLDSSQSSFFSLLLLSQVLCCSPIYLFWSDGCGLDINSHLLEMKGEVKGTQGSVTLEGLFANFSSSEISFFFHLLSALEWHCVFSFSGFVLVPLCGSRMVGVVFSVSPRHMSPCPHRWRAQTVCRHRARWS